MLLIRLDGTYVNAEKVATVETHPIHRHTQCLIYIDGRPEPLEVGLNADEAEEILRVAVYRANRTR